MLEHRQNGLPLLQFARLKSLPGVIHAVTTRVGGVSRPPFDTLNLAEGEDRPRDVAANLARLKESLGLGRLVFAQQMHGHEILAIDGLEDGRAGQADGLATDQPGVGLLIKQADCQAVTLVEPRRRVVANLHVGWRGNVLNLAGRGVRFLRERYGVEPSELYAAVSPSLGPCCAEFVNFQEELPESFLPFQQKPNHFDLWAVTRSQLMEAGLAADRIEFSGLCTRCHEQFYSYRRQRPTGRFGTVVALSEDLK